MGLAVAVLCLTHSACVSLGNGRRDIVAFHTTEPVGIDGKLDEGMWKKTPAYAMKHAGDAWNKTPKAVRKFFRNGVAAPGYIRLLWDRDFLYIGVEFFDDDIIAEGQKDDDPHFLLGDVAEVFLKPMKKPWYWELYVTPHGRKTSYFYKYPGRGWLPGFQEIGALTKMRTAASVSGALNDLNDKDRKWTAEMAIPISEVSAAGETLSPETPWLIFFGRFNYSRYLPMRENSSYPEQERNRYDFYEDYGELKLVKQP